MWWKFFSGLVFGLLSGSLVIAPLYLTAHQRNAALSIAASDYASQKFSRLTAEEINRRTLKAAAVIEGSYRRY